MKPSLVALTVSFFGMFICSSANALVIPGDRIAGPNNLNFFLSEIGPEDPIADDLTQGRTSALGPRGGEGVRVVRGDIVLLEHDLAGNGDPGDPRNTVSTNFSDVIRFFDNGVNSFATFFSDPGEQGFPTNFALEQVHEFYFEVPLPPQATGPFAGFQGGEGADITLNGNYRYLLVSDVAAVPEPSSVMLFGMGIFGLLGYIWRYRNNAV
jgi:hypothetical protein